jgi:hypothetical protein
VVDWAAEVQERDQRAVGRGEAGDYQPEVPLIGVTDLSLYLLVSLRSCTIWLHLACIRTLDFYSPL